MQRAVTFYLHSSLTPVFLLLGLLQVVVLASVFAINPEQPSATTLNDPLRHAGVVLLHLTNMIPLCCII